MNVVKWRRADWVSVFGTQFRWLPSQVCGQRVSDLVTVWRYGFDEEQHAAWRKG